MEYTTPSNRGIVIDTFTLFVQRFPQLSATFGNRWGEWKDRNSFKKCFKLLSCAGLVWASQNSLIRFHVGDNAHRNSVACAVDVQPACLEASKLDAIPIVDTVGEFIGGAALGGLLWCKGSKMRNSCLLHFFTCEEVI